MKEGGRPAAFFCAGSASVSERSQRLDFLEFQCRCPERAVKSSLFAGSRAAVLQLAKHPRSTFL